MSTVNYVDAICGGGKTEDAILRMIKGVMSGEKYILLQPSIPLIEQTAVRLKKNGYTGSLEIIHHKNGSEPVSKRIHAILDNPEASGVVIATTQGWEDIQRRSLTDWNLIIDECIQVFRVSKIETQHVKNELLQHLEIVEEADGYSKVKVRPGSEFALKQLEKTAKTDKAFETFQNTIRLLVLKTDTWVKTDYYKLFAEGIGKNLIFYHVINKRFIDGFKSVIIMSANFEQSELYLIWKHWGVHFKKRTVLYKKILSSSHSKIVGEKLDIWYLTDDWSECQKNKHYDIYSKEYTRAISEKIGNAPFIHTMNEKDRKKLVLEGFANSTYVSPKSHGINDYKNRDHVAIFAHFNVSKDQVAFLHTKFKLPFKTIWDMRNLDIYYQFVCRTSLRELPSAGSDVTNKIIIVMDKDMAFYLQSLFEGSRVHKFQSDLIDSIQMPKIGRKCIGSVPATGKERTKKSRDMKSLIDIGRKLQILDGTYWSYNDYEIPSSCNEMILNKDSDYIFEQEGGSVSILGKKDDISYDSYTFRNFIELVEKLREFSLNKVDRKSDNRLFNVTTFVHQDSYYKRRTKEYVLYSNAILMDMDSEDNCDPEEFSQFFSGIEMVIYSSFQSSIERRRWRVVINLSRAVSEPEYNRMAKDLLAICDNKGFRFDHKKRANDFMYLPCHGLNENAFFFKHYEGGTRKALNVDSWLNTGESKLSSQFNSIELANINIGILESNNQISIL